MIENLYELYKHVRFSRPELHLPETPFMKNLVSKEKFNFEDVYKWHSQALPLQEKDLMKKTYASKTKEKINKSPKIK